MKQTVKDILWLCGGYLAILLPLYGMWGVLQ